MVNRVTLLGGEQALSPVVKHPLEEMVYGRPSRLGSEYIYELVAPAVVHIEVDEKQDGSGFLVDSGGIIATNYHLVEGAENIVVETFDGSTYEVEEKVNYSVNSDLALISIGGWDHPTVTLGDSEDISTGQQVYVIGNPEGMKFSMSDGIVSYHDRYLEGWGNFIQHTAPVSSASSGSPMIDERGRVIGISTVFMTGEGVQNINFAVPVQKLKDLIDDPPMNIPLE